MFDNSISKKKWYLLIIKDPSYLAGESILKVLQILIRIEKFKFVILDDIEGAGGDWVIYSLQKKMEQVF
jgi:hypothetical protein